MGPSPNAGFDHHIDRAAGDDEVLDVVPPDKDELAALIDRCRLDHAKSAIARPQEAMGA